MRSTATSPARAVVRAWSAGLAKADNVRRYADALIGTLRVEAQVGEETLGIAWTCPPTDPPLTGLEPLTRPVGGRRRGD